MEEKKLLRILTIFICITISLFTSNVFANLDTDSQQVLTEIEDAKEYVLKEMLTKYSELQSLEGQTPEVIKDYNTNFRIFVSSSMPKSLLKNYAREATKYNATLVFKGLPNGSFKELISLVTEIESDGIKAPMQIDDEAFDKFNVSSVPAFVLCNEPGILKLGKGVTLYDKITGNIGIKAALEKFADSGELKQEAQKCLEASY